MTPEKVLVSWLAEFGYTRGACSDLRVAIRVARAERGAVRWAAELQAHERELQARELLRKSGRLTVRQMHGEPEPCRS